jgi:hypothetical protein
MKRSGLLKNCGGRSSKFHGAMTLSILTFSITTLSIKS